MAEAKKKYIELRQERDFGQIISTTFDFLFANFVGFFKTVFAITGFTFVLSMVVLSLWMYKFFGSLIGGARNYGRFAMGNEDAIQRMVEGFNLAYLVIGIVVLTVSFLITYLTIYSYIKIYVDKKTDEEITLPEVWQEVKANFLRYIGASIVYTIFFLIAYALIIFISTVIGFLGLLLFFAFIALIYYCYLYFIIIVNEPGMSVVDAFVRSFYLIKGKWWLTFGIYVVTYLLCYIISLLLGVAGGTLISAVSNLLDLEDVKILLVPLGISFSVIGIIYLYMVFCFFIIKNSVLYYSLVELKDSVGLLSKIHAIAHSDSTSSMQEVKVEKSNRQFTNDDIDEDF